MAEELEAMVAEDFSWHPCKVSRNSTGDGLLVEFESRDLEGFQLSKEEVLGRLRFQSLPLQGDDCSHIKEGELVVASPQTGDGACFFYAKVEKIPKVCENVFSIFCSLSRTSDKDGQRIPAAVLLLIQGCSLIWASAASLRLEWQLMVLVILVTRRLDVTFSQLKEEKKEIFT